MADSAPTCRTCRFRVNAVWYVCSQTDTWRSGVRPTVEHNPVTGLTQTTYPEGWGGLRPTIEAMRAPAGLCGVEGKLYEPRWRTQLWNWIIT